MTTVYELSAGECLRLLRSHPVHVGRVAVCVDGQPHIVPVNYRLDGDTVIIRTDPGTILHRAAAEGAVAFEVDAVDPAWEDGWSVVVVGHARRVRDDAELERVRQLPLRSWAGGDKDVYVRIVAERVTGRRIT